MTAALVDGHPVSFSYTFWQTDSWWDVSADTLPGYRRRGLAGACVRRLSRHLASEGKRPVMAPGEGETGTLAFLATLGLEPAGELYLFSK